jgi:hypothetical protein
MDWMQTKMNERPYLFLSKCMHEFIHPKKYIAAGVCSPMLDTGEGKKSLPLLSRTSQGDERGMIDYSVGGRCHNQVWMKESGEQG